VTPQLHLPDLPDVPLGGDERPPPPPRDPRGFSVRRALWQAAVSYSPLMLMALLAIGTWWLVQNAPQPLASGPAAPPRHEPDYTLRTFTLQNFTANGQLQIQIEGDRLRHYPDTNTLEVDEIRIHATDEQGRQTVATARRGWARADGSEVRLLDGAQVVSESESGPVEMTGDSLIAEIDAHRVVADSAVRVKQGSDQFTASGMVYDTRTEQLQLTGDVRARLMPRKAR